MARRLPPTRDPLEMPWYAPFVEPVQVPNAAHDQGTLRCFSINEKWIPYLLGALQVLKWPDVWKGTESEVLGAVGEAEALYNTLMSGNLPCTGIVGDCVEYLPHNGIFTFAPDNPWSPGEEPPSGYRSQVWRVGSSGFPAAFLSGVQATDVWCIPEIDFIVAEWLLGAISVGLPRFSFDLVGEGVMEIHFLEVPQGGYALITIDDNPFSADIVDLQAFSLGGLIDQIVELADDILDVTLAPIKIYEKEIVGAGSHHVDVTMIPKLGLVTNILDILNFGFGGGIRKVTWCAPDQPDDTTPPECDPPEIQTEIELVKLRINPEDSCEMQQFDPDTQMWVTVLDLAECEPIKKAGETNILIEFQIFQNVTIAIQNELAIYLGDTINYPPQVNVNAEDEADRDALLCYILERYVDATLDAFESDLDAAKAGKFLVQAVLTALVVVLTFSNPIVVGALIGAMGYATLEALDAISEEELGSELARDRVVCEMYKVMEGELLSQALFASSLDSAVFDTGSIEQRMQNLLIPILQSEEYYVGFINLMNDNLGLIGSIANTCVDCGSSLSGCTTYNYNWHETDPVPVEFEGERHVSHGGGLIGTLTKNVGDNWEWVDEWDEIRVVHTFDTPCVPAEIGFGYERKTSNSWYASLMLLTSVGWQEVVNQSGDSSGSIGAFYFSWENTEGISVYAIRWRMWSRRAVIWRSQIL